MNNFVKKLNKLFLVIFILVSLPTKKAYSLGWLGFGNQEPEKEEVQNTQEIEELNKEITHIFYEELEQSKQKNKDFIIKIISGIQSRLNNSIQKILERIIDTTQKSSFSNSMEYKITNHFAKVLNELREEMFSTNFSEKISSKLNTNLFSLETSNPQEINEKSIEAEDNIIEQSTKIFSNAFFENIALIKFNLNKMNTTNQSQHKEIIDNLIDSLILNAKKLTEIVIDQIVTNQIENLINYLLQESNCVTRTAARPVIKRKIINMLKQYLDDSLIKAKEQKQLIIDYALPHLNKICKQKNKAKLARKKRSKPASKSKRAKGKRRK